MIAHVVLLRPKPDLSDIDRRQLAAAFEHAVTAIPVVRRVQVGKRLMHGASYESAAPAIAEYAAIVEFDDLAGLQAYLRDPAHAELGRLFNSTLDAAMVYDFDLGSLDTLESLIR